MKVSLISIGNSKGVRIPASVIRECGLGAELELRVENGSVILSPARKVRGGWNEAFARMAAAGDDGPILPEDVGTQFDAEDWTW